MGDLARNDMIRALMSAGIIVPRVAPLFAFSQNSAESADTLERE
jgi:hypothetical protein